jgi:hypothetical protein
VSPSPDGRRGLFRRHCTLAGMARKLDIAVVRLLCLASFAFVVRGIWRWIQIFWNMPVLGILVDAAGRPVVHPANLDTFPYFSVAVVCGLCAMIAASMPDPEHFSLADMFITTTMVAVVLGVGVWLAR